VVGVLSTVEMVSVVEVLSVKSFVVEIEGMFVSVAPFLEVVVIIGG
jgi:hypothetical protein